MFQSTVALALLLFLSSSGVIPLVNGSLGTTTTATNEVTVPTANGPITGERITVATGIGGVAATAQIARFLGIRYAEPPLGELRFRRPMALRGSQPITARHWPPACVQNAAFMSPHLELFHGGGATSEDCLFLNVWTPVATISTEAINRKPLKPVIVFIHGGGLLMGSSAFTLHDGQTLAARGDVVVVTLNYRVGILGFMYSDEDEEVRGNQGFWDQTLALQWVQKNIASFGGDPNHVTIMGQSAGAWSVSSLILSPVSRTLFRNAILLSGAALNHKFVAEPDDWIRKILPGIRAVGCATGGDTKIGAKVLSCLRALNATDVDQLFFKLDKGAANSAITPLPVVDGTFLPDHPLRMLRSGNYKTDVNLLLSTAEDEGSFMWAAEPQFRPVNPDPLSLPEAKKFLTNYVSKQYLNESIGVSEMQMIEKIYFAGLVDGLYPQDRYRIRAGIAFGDLFLACPTMEFGRAVYAHAQNRTATVYEWHFRAKLGRPKIVCPHWTEGACHGDDLYPVFGIGFQNPDGYLDRERELSAEVMRFIAEFARSGTPGIPEWNAYFLAPNGQQVIRPYYEIDSGHRRPESFRFNRKQLECGQIWNRFNERAQSRAMKYV